MLWPPLPAGRRLPLRPARPPRPGPYRHRRVQWSGRFSPRGATEDEAVALFTGIHRDGLDALHRALAV
ncbi:SRPBCC family protein [Streptomyces griseofuscus]|uniref:hypothetical protein n=1 Tax=Streptomyces griseofuscus TaxID=146922 RepID=UPI00381491B3